MANPLSKRHWHNPKNPAQAARIEAAAWKRELKAHRLTLQSAWSVNKNFSHCDAFGNVPASLNPFYIAH